MNQFQMDVYIEPITSTAGETKPFLIAEIRIDGCHHGSKHTLDWRHLFQTLRFDGPFYPFTCGCGEPGCAGIWHPVLVCRDDTSIYWTAPTSLSEQFQDPVDVQSSVRFEFARREYWDAIWRAWRKACELLAANAEIEVGPYGFERKDLLALDRWIASEDATPWNRRKAWNDFLAEPLPLKESP